MSSSGPFFRLSVLFLLPDHSAIYVETLLSQETPSCEKKQSGSIPFRSELALLLVLRDSFFFTPLMEILYCKTPFSAVLAFNFTVAAVQSSLFGPPFDFFNFRWFLKTCPDLPSPSSPLGGVARNRRLT